MLKLLNLHQVLLNTLGGQILPLEITVILLLIGKELRSLGSETNFLQI